METLGRLGTGRGMALKSVLSRRNAFGLVPTRVAVDPIGEWAERARSLGGRELVISGQGRLDPLRVADSRAVAGKQGFWGGQAISLSDPVMVDPQTWELSSAAGPALASVCGSIGTGREAVSVKRGR